MVVLCIASVFVFSGCNNSLKADYDCKKYDDFETEHVYFTRDEIKHLIDNETPYDELITKEIDIHYMAEKYFTKELYFYGTLDDLMRDIGVECLRENTYGTLYSVHKVKQGGLLYIFYSDYATMLRWFYVRNNLSYADLADALQKNSTLEDLKKIDDTVQIFENLYNSYANWIDYWGYFGYHPVFLYLNDGILELSYQKEAGDFVITVGEPYTIFVDDFEIYDMIASTYKPYDATIYDMDRVK